MSYSRQGTSPFVSCRFENLLQHQMCSQQLSCHPKSTLACYVMCSTGMVDTDRLIFQKSSLATMQVTNMCEGNSEHMQQRPHCVQSQPALPKQARSLIIGFTSTPSDHKHHHYCHCYVTGSTAEADEEAVEPAHAAVVQAADSTEGLWAALKTVSWFQVTYFPASGTLYPDH